MAKEHMVVNQETDELVHAELLQRLGEGSPQPRLHATRRACELLDNPHSVHPIIHITGTNGKTSTSRIIESVLRASGLRTGLFTSPHLVAVNERIVVDGVPVSSEHLLASWVTARAAIESTDRELLDAGESVVTYFEALTVLAFVVFAAHPLDVVILEVGMGGRWDSTNVADAAVAVFTPIALDHAERLGKTVGEIASTKAGIIKAGCSVVSAHQPPAAWRELTHAATRMGAPVQASDSERTVSAVRKHAGGQEFTLEYDGAQHAGMFLPLLGAHQIDNAVLAIAAAAQFCQRADFLLTPEVLRTGLAAATSPGRLETVSSSPWTIVDAAHNPHGASALAATITNDLQPSYVVAVVGVLREKDARGILEALAPVVDAFVLTSSISERAIHPEELRLVAASLVEDSRLHSSPDIDSAVELAHALARDHLGSLVLITGSITLIAHAIASRDSHRAARTHTR